MSQTVNADDDLQSLTQQSKVAIKQLGSALKHTLTSTMKAKGPSAALEVCNIEAPIITTSVSTDQDIDVRRTSLKPRNSSNAPDSWERQILASFEQQKNEGVDMSMLEHGAITVIDGEKIFRFMKAIPTQAGCLACHGGTVKPDLKEKISALYPNDTATGFKEGDIRGAFTVKIKL
ncbi:Tll0287-like domain-containing protein [Alkalimarinus alittae]|uniref:DUF3365 domain-containing protein n=1 Tax=Alkalimarinus alittae TaxID=2961619 RepID=A0ABY6MXV3_9ALTE|nr:DUF3365 domain-containing protein [Alkalimarinus alittae]UZE94656.1 DUF3365 domain-containing protein [Alkalimarinus alittae]